MSKIVFANLQKPVSGQQIFISELPEFENFQKYKKLKIKFLSIPFSENHFRLGIMTKWRNGDFNGEMTK